MPADPELVALLVANAMNDTDASGASLLQKAWERGQELVESSPEDAWDLALAMLDATEDPYTIGYVGISLLEDLLDEHAMRFIDRLEIAVFQDPKMARAVASMWNDAPPITKRFHALVMRARERHGADYP